MNCIPIENEMGIVVAYYSNDYIVFDAIRSNSIYEQDIVMNVLYPFIKNSVKILDVGGHVGSH